MLKCKIYQWLKNVAQLSINCIEYIVKFIVSMLRNEGVLTLYIIMINIKFTKPDLNMM